MNSTPFNETKNFCKQVRQRYLTARIANSMLFIGSIGLGLCTVLSIIFSLLPWVVLPLFFDAIVLLCFLSPLLLVIDSLVIRPTSLLMVARMLEKNKGSTHQFLTAALELEEQKAGQTHSTQLIELVDQAAQQSLSTYPKTLPNNISRQTVSLFLGSLLLFIVLTPLATPHLLAWWDLPLRMSRSLHFRPQITPGSIAVKKYSSVVVTCKPENMTVPSARLTLTPMIAASVQQSHLLRPDAAGNFSFTLDSLSQSIIYTFSFGPTAFAPETISVIPPPLLYGIDITITPPAYTGLPVQKNTHGDASITAYAGSSAEVRIKSIFPLKTAALIFQEQPSKFFSVNHDSASLTLSIAKAGLYTFSLIDTLGQKNDSLPRFPITLIPDNPPNVAIVKPGRNMPLTTAAQETLWVQATDDFGLSAASLQYRKSSDSWSETQTKSILQEKTIQKMFKRSLIWNIAALSLYPSDTLFYWCHVADNRAFGGSQHTSSDTFFFRVPGFEEIVAMAEGKSDDAEKSLSGSQKLQEEMQQRLETLMKNKRNMAPDSTLSWQDRTILQEMNQLMQENQDSLKSAMNSLQEAVQKLKENGVGDQLIAKMNEVQKSLQQILQSLNDSLLLKNLQQPNTPLSWQDMKKSVEKMAQLLPSLSEQLDNTLKFLEMMRNESRRALLAAMAHQLSQQQQTIAQTQQTQADTKTLSAQNDLSSQIDQLLKNVTESTTQDSISARSLRQSPMQGQISTLNSAMKNKMAKNTVPTPQTMQQMSSALQELSNQLEQTLSMNALAKARRDRDRLISMAQASHTLAQWQQTMLSSAQLSEQSRQNLIKQHQSLQSALKEMMKTLDSMEVVPPAATAELLAAADSATAALSSALQSLDQTTNPAGLSPAGSDPTGSIQTRRNPSDDSPSQQLNGLTAALLSMAQQMSAQSSGGGQSGMEGLLSQLQQLSSQQAAINAATAQLLQQMLGSSGSPTGQGQNQPGSQGLGSESSPGSGQTEQGLEAARQAQKKLAEQLRQLSQRYKNSEDKSLLDRIKQLEKEAEELTQLYENPSMQLTDRQDRFLARMLQSTLSLHKQDEGKEERKSTSATMIYPQNSITTAAVPADAVDAFYNLRMKALQGNFPDSYRSSIQQYFDSLSILFLKPAIKPPNNR
ncbi:MAG: DUF4175 family protein [Chitinivibrionales bacterium]|nr:DUF4175 family protein [Chitinivibrionales bacterium]